MQAATNAIASSKDPRWDEFLIDLVQTDLGLTTGTKLRSLLGGAKPKPGRATALVIATIGRRGNRAHVKLLLKALASDSPPLVQASIVEALNELGDPSAIDPLLAVGLEAKDHRLGWPVNQAVLALAEPATVGKVRKIVASMKEGAPARGYYENLLQMLERKFPGQ